MNELINKQSNFTNDQRDQILTIKSFAKNYSGDLVRKSKTLFNYIFYDEREWRYVPKKSDIDNKPFSIGITQYNNNPDKYNNAISGYRIKFVPEDISYIIVKSTEQIPKMINFMRTIYSKIYTSDQLDILFSKICSIEQISTDF